MTTEEFELELRKLKGPLEMTEEQIQLALETHKRIKCGEISIEELKEKFEIP